MAFIEPVSSLSIKRAVNLYTIILFMSFSGLLYWFGVDRYQDFIDSHNNSADTTSRILAFQINKSLIDKQHEIDIFVDDHKRKLVDLTKRPHDNSISQQLISRLKKYQLDFIDFNIISKSGKVIFGKLNSIDNESCMDDVNHYFSTGEHQFHLHSGNSKYHYDVISRLPADKTGAVYLFRFSVNEFSDLLNSSQTAEHKLVLVNNEVGGSFGVTSQGDIKRIIGGMNFKIFNGVNLSTIAKTKVKDTSWYIVDMRDNNLFTDYRNKILKEYFIVFYIFAMIVLFMRHILLKQDVKRSIAEDQLKSNHDQIKVLNNSLDLLSKSDSLTSLYNRRYFDEMIQHEWDRGQRTKETIICILLDIDYFKKYNDFYGHQAGDKCIQDISGLLKDTFRRAGDIVARYGGEEFIISMAGSSEEEAKVVLIKLQFALKKLKIAHQASDTDKYVTVSVGLATQIPTQNTSVEQLIRNADEALYKAKQNGRNQFVVHIEEKNVEWNVV